VVFCLRAAGAQGYVGAGAAWGGGSGRAEAGPTTSSDEQTAGHRAARIATHLDCDATCYGRRMGSAEGDCFWG